MKLCLPTKITLNKSGDSWFPWQLYCVGCVVLLVDSDDGMHFSLATTVQISGDCNTSTNSIKGQNQWGCLLISEGAFLSVGVPSYQWGCLPISGGAFLSVGVPSYQWGCLLISGGAFLSVRVPSYQWGCLPIIEGAFLSVGVPSYQ